MAMPEAHQHFFVVAAQNLAGPYWRVLPGTMTFAYHGTYLLILRSGWKYGGHPEKRPLTGLPDTRKNSSSSYCWLLEYNEKWSG